MGKNIIITMLSLICFIISYIQITNKSKSKLTLFIIQYLIYLLFLLITTSILLKTIIGLTVVGSSFSSVLYIGNEEKKFKEIRSKLIPFMLILILSIILYVYLK